MRYVKWLTTEGAGLTTGASATDTAVAGGERMVNPIMILGSIALAEMIDKGWNVYSTNQTTKANDVQNRYLQQFYGAYASESADYLRRYIRAHHLEGRTFRYPIRSGLSPNLSALYGANARIVSNKYARAGSYVKLGTGVSRSLGFGYLGLGYVPKKNFTNPMYG